MRTLITGGAGFIGSALVRHLAARPGEEVLTVDKLTYAGTRESLRELQGARNHRFLNADICDAAAMRDAFRDFSPDRVFHLAAETHVDRSIGENTAFVQTNIVGAANLLEAARDYWVGLPEQGRRAFRFVHVSTDEVYGSLGDTGLFAETTPYDPSSPYSASKAASDHLAVAWQRTYGLPVIVSNCSNNYGPFQFPEKLIPLTILNALEGRSLPVYGRGLNIRDWLHVDDHVGALVAISARGRPGERYNVGARCERRNIDVVRAICSILDRMRPAGAPHDRLISFVEDRPGHDLRYAIDPAKLEAETGWLPLESFERGLERTVAWYCENEWWWRPLRDGVYRGDRLGLTA